ncbi:MAG: hypothetical protein Q8P57_05515 [Candidatus Pacearchaeota archaeon]|nr:hypothetical protein [Candidatus Pacearchaeota archaeon]
MESFFIFKRGQSAIEFTILVGAVLFFFIMMAFSIQINIADKTSEKRNLVLQDTALNLKDEIRLAHEASDGYRRTFVLPVTLLGLNYLISIDGGNSVYIRTLDEKYAASYPILIVTGNPQAGENLIEKIDGVVYLNREE